MALRGIYFSQKNKKLTFDKVERAIFTYLHRNPKGATQTQLAEELKIPRGQIIARLKKLENKVFPYNKRTYRVVKTNHVYTILCEKETTQGLSSSSTQQQKDEFQSRFENEVESIAKSGVLTEEAAEIIDDEIIFCGVNNKKKLDFKSSILKLYNADIHDIAVGEKGICIVLKEDLNDVEKLDRIKESIVQLYAESRKRQRNTRRKQRKN